MQCCISGDNVFPFATDCLHSQLPMFMLLSACQYALSFSADSSLDQIYSVSGNKKWPPLMKAVPINPFTNNNFVITLSIISTGVPYN